MVLLYSCINMNAAGYVLAIVLLISTRSFADEHGNNVGVRIPFVGSNGPIRLRSSGVSSASFSMPSAAGVVSDDFVVAQSTPVSVVNTGSVGVGAPGLVISDIDVNGDGFGRRLEADVSMRVGGDTVDFDARGFGFGFGFPGMWGPGVFGINGDFGEGGFVSFGGGGRPVTLGGGGRVSGFPQFGIRGSGGASASAVATASAGGVAGGFSRPVAPTLGPWGSNTWSSGIGGGASGISFGFGSGGGVGGGVGLGNAGRRFIGGFGGHNFGLRSFSSPTTVISDADTAVVNAGMGGSTVISDADTAFVNRAGQGSTFISDADTAIVNQAPMSFVRPSVPVRVLSRPSFGFSAPMPSMAPARAPMAPLLPLLGPMMPARPISPAPAIRPFIPLPRFTYRNSFGLGSFSRLSGLRSSFGRIGALRRIASAPVRPTFISSGIVPGNKGYASYYRNKYSSGPKFFFPTRSYGFSRKRAY